MNYNNYKSIWYLTWPLILSGVGQTVINVTDTLFLGRLGETALGASAISGLFYATFLMMSFGLASGTQILVARHTGSNEPDKVALFFNQANVLQLLVSMVLTVLFYLFYNPLLELIVSGKEIREASAEFLRFRFLGFVPIFLFSSIRAYFGGVGKTKVITYATIILALTNFILNYILVFGKFGFPSLGIKGSAIASSIAELIACLYIVLYAINFNKRNNASLYFKLNINKQALHGLINLSYPIVFQFMISLISWFVFFLLVEKVGQTELAVSNLVRNVYMIIMSPILAFTQSTSTVISHHIGMGEYKVLRSILKKVISLSFVFTIVIVLITLLIPRYLFLLFTDNVALVETGIPVLNLVCFALILFSVSVPLLSALSATGKSKISFIIEFATMFLYIGLSYWFALKLNLNLTGIWSVEIIYFIAIGISAYYFLNKFIKSKYESF